MFERIKTAIKGGLVKMNIIKEVNNVQELDKITIGSTMYDHISKWMALYKGYEASIHDYSYMTVVGEKKRQLMSMNIAKVSANEMASLIFNEKCEISINDEDIKELITRIFRRNKFTKNFQDFLEYGFAMGGMVVKPFYDGEDIMLDFVTADNFIPVSWKNGNIYEALFPYTFTEKGKHYTHLEWHLWEKVNGQRVYTVRNELYKSDDKTKIGIRTPLTASKVTERLEAEATIAGITQSLFTYIKPSTANNVELGSPLGVSIYSNAIDTIKAIDTAYDSFHREFRLGKKRILVPATFIKTVIDPVTKTASRYFDANDETYEAYPASTDNEAEPIKDISTELRVEEHIAAINALLNIYAMQTGFSSGTFTFNGQSVKTATEVISENSKTFKSKQSHENIIEDGLRELVGSIVALANLYQLTNKTEFDMSVKFDDSIAEDVTADTNRQIQLVSAQLQSKKRAIMSIFGKTEEEADIILSEIAHEQGREAVGSSEEINRVTFGGEE